MSLFPQITPGANARRILAAACLAIVSCGLAGPAAAAEAPAFPPFFDHDLQPFLVKNCAACHNAEKHSGDLNLQDFAQAATFEKDRDTWELIVSRVEKGEMPPKKAAQQPDPAERKHIVDGLTAEFTRLDLKTPLDPGRVTTRRLNRTEYNNTLHDLLGVNLTPADDFAPDDSGYGFDNNGDVLSMSPTLLEKYLKAAEKVARTAIYGVEPLKPTSEVHQPWYIDFDTVNVVKSDYDETGLSMPHALHVMHRFPVEGDYELTGWVRGFRPVGSNPVPMAYWVDGKFVHQDTVIPLYDGELNGLYTNFTIHLTAGEHWMSVTIPKIYEGLPAAYGGPNPNDSTARIGKKATEFLVQNLKVVGPLPGTQVLGPAPESLKKIYGSFDPKAKHTLADARAILTNLAQRAYRRPVTPQEVDQLVKLVELVQTAGDTFEEGLCVALQRLLISPNFLYRIERGVPSAPPGAPVQLTPYELASRLSYFLWATMPDDELFRLAGDNRLAQPGVMDAQVRRMLKDPKARSLAVDFGGQWLQYRALESHVLERKQFQKYTEYTRMSMQQETEHFFNYIVQEDRPVLDFINGHYTFLNERMADFYGIPGVKGTEFRKVELDPKTFRVGVLTQASVLTVSSYANRTSPVIRGKWVLENILNAAPPPPPANVPSLKEEEVGTAVSLRQQLEAHRANPTCAGCHSRMDQLGFGLENFDAIGAWRDYDGNFPVDSSGALPDGRSFTGPAQLAETLMVDKDAFAQCITDKMLTYALGRGLTRGDKATVKAVAAQMATQDYRFSSLVLGIVHSPQFQMRGVTPPKS